MTNVKGMHNQVLSGSTPSIFLLYVSVSQMWCEGLATKQEFYFTIQKEKKKKLGGKGLLFKSVFIMHQNKAIVLPKPSHIRAREEKEEEAKQQIGQHLGFPLQRRRPSSQALSSRGGTPMWTALPEGRGQPGFLPTHTPLINSLSPSAPISLEPLHST